MAPASGSLRSGGASPLDQLDAVKSELEKSDALQETLRGTIPAHTQEIVELNGLTSSHPRSGVLKEVGQVRQMCATKCCVRAHRHVPYFVACRWRAWTAYPKHPLLGWELTKRSNVYFQKCSDIIVGL